MLWCVPFVLSNFVQRLSEIKRIRRDSLYESLDLLEHLCGFSCNSFTHDCGHFHTVFPVPSLNYVHPPSDARYESEVAPSSKGSASHPYHLAIQIGPQTLPYSLLVETSQPILFGEENRLCVEPSSPVGMYERFRRLSGSIRCTDIPWPSPILLRSD